MRIDLKDVEGRPRLTLHVDTAKPATVARADDGRGPAVTLDWDRALDDEGHLRHCPVCGCPDLYLRKQVPQLTVFALVLVAAVIAMIFFGSGLNRAALVVLGVVLVADLLIFFFAPRVLVCYRCGSEYRDLPLGRGRRRWDAALAERHRRAEPAGGGEPAATAPPSADAAAPVDQREQPRPHGGAA